MRFDFIKCHGSGNDFPLIDGRGLSLTPPEWARVAVALADRRGPVGGDGLLVLGEGRDGADFSMFMFNSDGSEAETCLNGLRCVARAGFAALGIDRATVSLKTSTATVARAADLFPGVYTVRETAGPANLDITTWPARIGTSRLIEAPVPPLRSARRFTAIAMPNPHLIAFVDAIDDAELVAIGRACEAAPPWLPNRANVSFVERLGLGVLFVRTCERGVGLTDSCGSAMAAATYAACLTLRCQYDREIEVRNRGGMVRATAGTDGMVTLSGNATFEWHGSIDFDPATGALGPVEVTGRNADEIAAWQAVSSAALRAQQKPLRIVVDAQ